MRIALFGGTFDPVHYGHLRLAEEAREAAQLTRVLFMPAHISPFRLGEYHSAPHHRLQMLLLATRDNPHFEVSDHELQRGGISYTVDTVRYLRAQHPNAELYLIMGADTLAGFQRWRQPEVIAQECTLLVGVRPEYDLNAALDSLPAAIRARVHPVPMTPLGISASAIRDQIRAGHSIRYLTPPDVIEYIIRNRLYVEP